MTGNNHRASGTDYTRGCRCRVCTTAHRRRVSRYRDSRYANRTLVDGRWIARVPADRHGSITTYNTHGCRCEPCTTANSAASATRRARIRQGT